MEFIGLKCRRLNYFMLRIFSFFIYISNQLLVYKQNIRAIKKFNPRIGSRALSSGEEALLLNSIASNKGKILSSLRAFQLPSLPARWLTNLSACDLLRFNRARK
jgi:hypothetical protein